MSIPLFGYENAPDVTQETGEDAGNVEIFDAVYLDDADDDETFSTDPVGEAEV